MDFESRFRITLISPLPLRLLLKTKLDFLNVSMHVLRTLTGFGVYFSYLTPCKDRNATF